MVHGYPESMGVGMDQKQFVCLSFCPHNCICCLTQTPLNSNTHTHTHTHTHTLTVCCFNITHQGPLHTSEPYGTTIVLAKQV